jgi:tRNA (cmo5U34)-methyltransferase
MDKRFAVIKEHFERAAADFDKHFIRFAPGYEEAIEALVSAMPFRSGSRISIADLGCGTGNIAAAVLKKYPNARVSCIDLSEKMISLAKAKLGGFKSVEFHTGDLRDYKFMRKYDAVVSSLVLHHFEGRDKERFYKRIYGCLKKGGVFYNSDITQGSNGYLQGMYIEKWVDFLRKGCSPAEIKRTLRNHKREDRPAALMEELGTLAKAGFRDIDVVYKRYYFSVYGGVK